MEEALDLSFDRLLMMMIMIYTYIYIYMHVYIYIYIYIYSCVFINLVRLNACSKCTSQKMYVERSIKARAINNCCSGKSVGISYSERVFVLQISSVQGACARL